MFKLFGKRKQKETTIELIKYGDIYYVVKDGIVSKATCTASIVEAEAFYNHFVSWAKEKHFEREVIKHTTI